MTIVNKQIYQFAKKKRTTLNTVDLPDIKDFNGEQFDSQHTEYVCIDEVFRKQFDDEKCLFMIKQSTEGLPKGEKSRKTIFYSKKNITFFDGAKKQKIEFKKDIGDFFALSVLSFKN